MLRSRFSEDGSPEPLCCNVGVWRGGECVQRLCLELLLPDDGGAGGGVRAAAVEENLTMLGGWRGDEEVRVEVASGRVEAFLAAEDQVGAGMYCLGRGVLHAARVAEGKKHRMALALDGGATARVRSAGGRKASVVTAGVTLEIWVGAASTALAADLLRQGVTLGLAEVGDGVPLHRSRERICRVILEDGEGGEGCEGGVVAWGLEGGTLNRRERVDRLIRIDARGAGVFEVEGRAVTLQLRCCAIPREQDDCLAGEAEDGSSFVEVCAWLQALEARILRQLWCAIEQDEDDEVLSAAPDEATRQVEGRRTSYVV